jgi:hypothetical protein
MQDRETWLELHDPEFSSADLVAEVERRVLLRRKELGQVRLVFPTFGAVSPFPEPPTNRPYNPNLYHHLRQANEMGPPETVPILADSPATQIPLLGRFWKLIRGQFHELILFYVNRFVAQETKMDNHLISSINELTRVIQLQQEEIDSLQDEVKALKQGPR